MALCNSCQFMQERYDKFRQDYDDVDIIGDDRGKHYCPMYDDNIPNGIYYDGDNCKFYEAKE